MNKVTLAFPTYDSLWLFKEKSKGVNVAVAPMKKTITALFTSEEVEIAQIQFQAVPVSGSPTGKTSSVIQSDTERGVPLKIRFLQLFRFGFQPLGRQTQ